jgi:predicted GIY-YIG superfamily endonuclease
MKYQRKKYSKFYLYGLFDSQNVLLYVGQTAVPKNRMKGHYYNKSGPFYKRKDLELMILQVYDNRLEAQLAEHQWQKYYWPDAESDMEKKIRGCHTGGDNPQKEGRRKGGSLGGPKGGLVASHRLFTMSCGREIKTEGAMGYHRKVCGCSVLRWVQLP